VTADGPVLVVDDEADLISTYERLLRRNSPDQRAFPGNSELGRNVLRWGDAASRSPIRHGSVGT
jgi:hypothetical protein